MLLYKQQQIKIINKKEKEKMSGHSKFANIKHKTSEHRRCQLVRLSIDRCTATSSEPSIDVQLRTSASIDVQLRSV